MGKVALKFGAKTSIKAKIKEIAKHNVIKFNREDDPTLIKLTSTRKIQQFAEQTIKYKMDPNEILKMVNTDKMNQVQKNCLVRELELSILQRNL